MDVAKAIIEAGARYDIKDEHGKTAFDWVEGEGLKERYKKIVKDYKLSIEYKAGSSKDVRINMVLYIYFIYLFYIIIIIL